MSIIFDNVLHKIHLSLNPLNACKQDTESEKIIKVFSLQ